MTESMTDSCDEVGPLNLAGEALGVERDLVRIAPGTGLLTGVLIGFTEGGDPLVLFDNSPMHSSVVARSCVYLERGFVGRTIMLHLEEGDSCKPVILGTILSSPLRRGSDAATNGKCLSPEHVEIDGERIVLSAAREMTLQCGDASLTMTRAGKIVMRGSHIATRATGVNAIKGGSVEIN